MDDQKAAEGEPGKQLNKELEIQKTSWSHLESCIGVSLNKVSVLVGYIIRHISVIQPGKRVSQTP